MSEDFRNRRKTRARLAQDLGAALLAGRGGDGLLVCDQSGRVAFCNEAAARFLVMRRAQTDRRPLAELLGGRNDETAALRFASALQGAAAVEFVVARGGAQDEWTEVRALPLRQGMAFFLKEVTERERSERLLRRKEQRLLATNESLRMAHHAARGASWEWRAGRGLRWIDLGAARQLAGLPRSWTDEDVVTDWRTLIGSQDAEAAANAEAALQQTGSATFEFQLVGADQRLHWMECSAMVVERGRDDLPILVSGIILDVTERKASERALRLEIAERRRAQAHQQLLIHELNHRVKNVLATVQSVARQSLRPRRTGGVEVFEDRLMALAWAHDVLTKENWVGASLLTLVRRTMEAHAGSDQARARIEGPDLRVPPNMALALTMGLHELATNAAKYGALSADRGRVLVSWRVEDDQVGPTLLLDWREEGGPPVEPPVARGFGSRLIERGLAAELGGSAHLSFAVEGVRCEIRAPLPAPEAPGAEPGFDSSDGGDPQPPRAS